jgi:hypothetical protein
MDIGSAVTVLTTVTVRAPATVVIVVEIVGGLEVNAFYPSSTDLSPATVTH